ncbi:MAG: 2-oxo acid dehydrogenase subunit E2 [bacterium]|nr:2-oxo acid dehydrogenase subunit E2 [bacterium]
MPTKLTMPRLSDTMTTGKIIEWKKKVGDKVEPGDVLAEIESDKATMEFEAFEEGILLEILVPSGGTAPVGEVLAILGEVGTVPLESQPTSFRQESKSIETENKDLQKKTEEIKKVEGVDVPPKDVQKISPLTLKDKKETVVREPSSRILASPLALRLAAELGVDLTQVKGSGPDGRIIREDIERYAKMKEQTPHPISVPSPTPPKIQSPKQPTSSEGTILELTQMRSAIARRMAEGWQTPMFTLTMDIRMDAVEQIREQWKELGKSVVPTINDFVLCAVSRALHQYPQMNVSFRENSIVQYHDVHVAFAVALPEGLITPVIFHADKKSLSQIAEESKQLIDKAFAKKLQIEEFSGSTFTISNLGKMDIEHFTAIVNPPEAGILAIGRVREAVVVRGGEIAIEQRMYVTLSADHRAIDGAMGAEFLGIVRKFLEHPISLILD